MADDRPLSTGEVARLLHVTRVAVLLWIRAGKLKASRVPGGRYRIARADFRKFLTDNELPVTFETPPPKRILVVDDEATVRQAFQAALQAKGYEVALASDGREALRIIRGESFDLIFLDILLPKIGGSTVLKAIKRRDPEAVVVIITGHPHHEETLVALEYGPAVLLRKPIRLSDLDAVFDIVFKR
ncbi:MAG: response regulator [Candidatus Rokubacteria bacterium]|nr:response regulator [Candidatus Rokubacteria bacterium]